MLNEDDDDDDIDLTCTVYMFGIPSSLSWWLCQHLCLWSCTRDTDKASNDLWLRSNSVYALRLLAKMQ